MFFARDEIEFPAELAAALAPHARVAPAALRALWEKLAKGRGQKREGETHYSFRREEAEAYAAYYLPANCLKVPLVLEESLLAGVDPLPTGQADWLDFGTGPGTAFWGLAWWCARRGKKLRFTGWDQSPAFATIARNLTARSPFGAAPEFLVARETPLELIEKRKPTHVSFVNSLAEIYPDPAQRQAEVARILGALRTLERADGRARFLLLVEPGSRDSSRELAGLKDTLGPHVLFPCLDARPCGALARPDDWCHEEVACRFPAWLNELGAAAGLRKESILFSYVLLRASEAASGFSGAARIVSQRMERKGQVECRLCTPAGKAMVRVQRSKATPENESFFGAVRGDLWRRSELGEKGDLVRAEVVAPTIPSVFES